MTCNLEKKSDLKLKFLVGKVDVEKRNEDRDLFGKLGCGSADMSPASCFLKGNASENGLIDLAQRLGSRGSKALWTLKLAHDGVAAYDRNLVLCSMLETPDCP